MDMSLTQTAIPSRQVIDLTTEPSPPAALVVHAVGAPSGEPPAKRQRVDHGGSNSATRPLKECMRLQLLPHVKRAIAGLPAGDYDKGSVAVQALTAIAQTSWFTTRFRETGGYLSAPTEVVVEAAAAVEVRRIVYGAEPTTMDSWVTRPQADRLSGKLAIKQRSHSYTPPAVPARPTEQVTYPIVGLSPPTATTWPLPTEASLNASRLARRNRAQPSKRLQLQPPLPTSYRATQPPTPPTWFKLLRKPYLTAEDRNAFADGIRQPIKVTPGPEDSAKDRDAVADGIQHPLKVKSEPKERTIYHVDFSSDEVAQILAEIAKYVPVQRAPTDLDTLRPFCSQFPVSSLVRIPGRTEEDVANFWLDLRLGRAAALEQGRVVSLGQSTERRREQSSRVSSLLFARELEGNAGFGRMRRLENFGNEFKKAREDELGVVAEFTNCAGDISTISWVSEHEFICGTTAHSDTHNQQYNKPGNLLMCSTTQGNLRAYPDHRIPRPVVEKGENSTDAMRESQDPWLYSSVVSSDYDELNDRAYTSSFDKTVKVWRVDADGMTALASWPHDGNVNFVAAAKDGSGLVATASDIPTEAVRIYHVTDDSIAGHAVPKWKTFSCTRPDAEGSDKWAYFPATMQWGRAPGTQHLLLVGYSPRSVTGDDNDIPEDKMKTGEIVLWDTLNSCRLNLSPATTANCFEVAWHPTLMRFAVATTPGGNVSEKVIHARTRTQIHLFRLDKDRQDGGYCEFQSLDCPASDINELTFMPNSVQHAYVTAACTNGRVYVWDSAQGDMPLHTLKHGDPIDAFSGDREREDTGVKFTAWGTSLNRFYTGGSDGVVKVWDVRRGSKPLERVLFNAPAPISFGAFSPDFTKLAVGDATGRVFLLSVDRRDELESDYMTVPGIEPGTTRLVRRPRPFIPHPDPPAPIPGPEKMDLDVEEPDVVTYTRQTYLDTQQLVLTGNPIIGAVQGPLYAATGHFRREAHFDEDPAAPLLSQYDRLQMASVLASRGLRRRSLLRLKPVEEPGERLQRAHRANKALDLDIGALDRGVWEDLINAGALLSLEGDEGWGLVDEETQDA